MSMEIIPQPPGLALPLMIAGAAKRAACILSLE
jgi:hypothetical protein